MPEPDDPRVVALAAMIRALATAIRAPRPADADIYAHCYVKVRTHYISATSLSFTDSVADAEADAFMHAEAALQAPNLNFTPEERAQIDATYTLLFT